MSWPSVACRELFRAHYGKALKVADRKQSGNVIVYGSSGAVGKHTDALIERPTIIIGRKGSVGDIVYVDHPSWTIDTAYYAEILDINRCDLRYLFYALGNANLSNLTITTSIPGLNRDDLYDTKIPLPPLDEQKRIAAILDKADGLRRKREKAIALTDNLLRSVFLDMFGDPVTNPKGWEVGKVGDCVNQVRGGWSAKGDARPARSDEMGVLKISAVTSGDFKPEKNKFVSSIPSNKNLIVPQKGDLLFSRANTRELVAATCIVLRSAENVFLPDKLWHLDLNSDVAEAAYLKFVFSHPEYRRVLCTRATGTSGSMLNISKGKLLAHLIPIPPIALQCEFSNIWGAVRSLSAKVKTDCDNVQQLFSSLTQRAFKGELTDKDKVAA